MTAQWVKYVANTEQIKELKAAIKSGNGVLIKNKYGECKIVTSQLYACEFTEYLICTPHPYANMAQQWLRTGQPVWWRSKDSGETGLCHEYFPPFMHPVEFEYSFTPFEEEV